MFPSPKHNDTSIVLIFATKVPLLITLSEWGWDLELSVFNRLRPTCKRARPSLSRAWASAGVQPFQGHFSTTQDEVKVAQPCLTLCDPMDSSSVHGILQARILEWLAFPFSRGSSQPRDQTQVSHIAGRFFTSWATREAHSEKHCYIFFLVKTTGYLNKTVYYIELSFFPFRSEYKYYNSREIIGKWDC